MATLYAPMTYPQQFYQPQNQLSVPGAFRIAGKVAGKAVKWQVILTLLLAGILFPPIWIVMLIWFILTRCIGAGVRIGTKGLRQ